MKNILFNALGYRMLNFNAKEFQSNLWSKDWTKGLIPKISYFLWTTVLNKNLMNDNLRKGGIFKFPNR